jgi:hypothetical protein
MNALCSLLAICRFFSFHVFWVGWGVVDEYFHAWSSSFNTIALFPILYSAGFLFLGYGLAYHSQ